MLAVSVAALAILLLVVLAVTVAEAVAVALPAVLAEMVETVSFTSTTKMYAVVLDEIVISPFIGNEEELLKAKEQYPQHKFIEMTIENSPIAIGDKL
jgi:hypothetical protein